MRDDEILGLVGPNGSGKTTFLNALTGVVPAAGSLEVAGEPVPLGDARSEPGGRRAAHVPGAADLRPAVVHRGRAPLDLGPPVHGDARRRGSCARSVLRRERARWAIAVDALARVGLGDLAEQPAGRLTYGQRRLLELARAIAAQTARPDARRAVGRPRRVGDRDSSRGTSVDLRDEGVSLLVIDHKLDFITSLCDRVAVLELGHLVAVGDAATVFADQRVVDAYLGVAEVD